MVKGCKVVFQLRLRNPRHPFAPAHFIEPLQRLW